MCTTKLQLLKQHGPGKKKKKKTYRPKKESTDPEINPHIYGQLIFDKSTRTHIRERQSLC